MKKIFSAVLLYILFFCSPKLYAQDPFVGEIAAVGFNYAPAGWLKCDGSLLQIADYDVLFSVIGTTYGGDGIETFAVPDFRGRTLIGVGQGPGLTNRVVGQSGGARTATLAVANLPQHFHSIEASTGSGTRSSPAGAVMANTGALDKEFTNSASVNTSMATTADAGSIVPNPIDISQPYQGINYIIAVWGIYPTQN